MKMQMEDCSSLLFSWYAYLLCVQNMDFIDNLIVLSIFCVISALLLVYAGILIFINPIILGFILIALIFVYVFRVRALAVLTYFLNYIPCLL